MWLAWLRPAFSDVTEAELLAEIAAGCAQLWIGDDAALVTQLCTDHDGPCAHIWLAGGTLEGVLALRLGIEAWARGLGCRSITIEGRNGWDRVLRRFGYRRVGRELKRMLHEQTQIYESDQSEQ